MKIDRNHRRHTESAEWASRRQKWTAGKGRRPFAPRRWARYVLVGFKRVMMVMPSVGEALGKGGGRVKGRGERPEGEAGRDISLAWGLPWSVMD